MHVAKFLVQRNIGVSKYTPCYLLRRITYHRADKGGPDMHPFHRVRHTAIPYILYHRSHDFLQMFRNLYIILFVGIFTVTHPAQSHHQDVGT